MARGSTTRDALLDAAYAAAVAGGWNRARMADVAAAAGVSRQTLYNEFGGKDALAEALARREGERFLDATDAAVFDAAPADPAAAVAAAVEATLVRAADDPLLKAVLTDDTGGLLPYVTTRAGWLLAAARGRLAGQLLERWPGLEAADVRLVADAVVRLTVSYLVLPPDAGDPQTAESTAATVAARVARLAASLLHTRTDQPREAHR